MSHMRCPLCGLNRPLSNYDPSTYDLDIRKVEFTSKGYKKGFEVSEEYSALGDEDVTPPVVNRVKELFSFFVREGLVDPQILNETLKVKPKEIVKLVPFKDPILREQQDYSARTQIMNLKDEIQKLKEELHNLLVVEKVLGLFFKVL